MQDERLELKGMPLQTEQRQQGSTLNDLLSCPFCKARPHRILLMQHGPLGGRNKFNVQCYWCEATGPSDAMQNEAIKRWNNALR